MKKYLSVFLLILFGFFYFFCALGSSSSNKFEKVSQIYKDHPKVTFSKETIYENNSVIMKVTGSENTSEGTKINFYIENNSNLNLSFCAHSYGVNGIMTRNNIYDMRTEVASGKKANTSLLIENSLLTDYDIDYIKYVDILFWAYDNDKSIKSFETNVIRIKSDKYDEYSSWLSGKEVYNKNKIKIDYLSTDNDKIKYVVTNTTGNNLVITFNGISINDYTVSGTDFDLYDEQILNNNQCVFEINVKNDFKTQNNIKSITKVDFYLSYRENTDYTTHKTENITTIIKK